MGIPAILRNRLAQWGVIVGMIGVFAGIAIQLFFGLRRDRRESEAHEASMLRAKRGPSG